jgi:YHS domain-containing protein
MLRVFIYTVLLILFARAVAKFWHGLVEGASGMPPREGATSVPQRGVQMARDPVCGTFVVPGRSVTLTVAGEALYFCSTECRDRFRAAPGGSRRSAAAASEGRRA